MTRETRVSPMVARRDPGVSSTTPIPSPEVRIVGGPTIESTRAERVQQLKRAAAQHGLAASVNGAPSRPGSEHSGQRAQTSARRGGWQGLLQSGGEEDPQQGLAI